MIPWYDKLRIKINRFFTRKIEGTIWMPYITEDDPIILTSDCVRKEMLEKKIPSSYYQEMEIK